jgi:hypothetical protein
VDEQHADAASKETDRFELVTAVLLGLTAVGAALAALQSGQWGGRQLDAFSEANTLTTKASTQYNEDTVLMNADYAAVAVAKQNILEARDAADAVDRERHLDLASYFYMTQLSQVAYKAMELPEGYWEEDEEEAGETAKAPEAASGSEAAPAAEGGEAGDEAEDGGDEAAAPGGAAPAAAENATLERDIPDEALFASLEVELDDEYADKMLAEGTAMFEKADKRFGEGRVANEHGDSFDMVGVFYTVALVFAGLGLVFKTRMRWGMFSLGASIFVIATLRMITLPWAG